MTQYIVCLFCKEREHKMRRGKKNKSQSEEGWGDVDKVAHVIKKKKEREGLRGIRGAYASDLSFPTKNKKQVPYSNMW